MIYKMDFYVNGKVVDSINSYSSSAYAISGAATIFLEERGWNDRLSGDDLIKVAVRNEDKRITEHRKRKDVYTMR